MVSCKWPLLRFCNSSYFTSNTSNLPVESYWEFVVKYNSKPMLQHNPKAKSPEEAASSHRHFWHLILLGNTCHDASFSWNRISFESKSSKKWVIMFLVNGNCKWKSYPRTTISAHKPRPNTYLYTRKNRLGPSHVFSFHQRRGIFVFVITFESFCTTYNYVCIAFHK